MNFLLAGFKGRGEVRQFAFDCVADDRSRRRVVVGADMILARKHSIRPQELPLICVRLLESLGQDGLQESITLTEDHMKAIEAAAQNVPPKAPHRQGRVSPQVGQAWRRPQP